ncbi:hypothetical protein HOH67_03095 [Candidatus Peregrinibacteria bacterium]|nr:hypothetical protein [Candidatus Peregrinibacteria bacterium]
MKPLRISAVDPDGNRVLRENTIGQLAASNVKDIPHPELSRFQQDVETATSKEEIDLAIKAVLFAIDHCLKSETFEIPAGIRDNPIYAHFVGKRMPTKIAVDAEKQLIADDLDYVTELTPIKFRNVLGFFPFVINEERVYEQLDALSEALVKAIIEETHTVHDETRNKAKDTVKNTLIYLLREAIERFDKQKVIGLGDTIFSAKEIRDAVALAKEEINGQRKTPEEKDTILAEKLGLTDLDQNLLVSSRQLAWSYYFKHLEKLSTANKRLIRLTDSTEGDDTDTQEGSVDGSIIFRCNSLYAMLNYALHASEGGSIADRATMKAVAHLSGLFYLILKNELFQKTESACEKIDRILAEEILTEATEVITIFRDSEKRIVKEATTDGNDMRVSLRKIKGSDSEQRVHFVDLRFKTEDSVETKLLIYPSYDLEDIPDYIAGTLIMWDLNYEDLDPKKIQELREIGIETGQKLGMAHADGKTRDELNPGEFMVKNNFKGNGKNRKSAKYRAMKICGYTGTAENPGTKVEIQIILEDEFRASNDMNSPKSHWYYDLERGLEVNAILHRDTSHPEIVALNTATRKRLRAHKAGLEIAT